jgi:hypothetical protein
MSLGVAARDGVVVSDADFAGVPSGSDEQLSVATVGVILLADVNLADVPSVVEQLLVFSVGDVVVVDVNLTDVPSVVGQLMVVTVLAVRDVVVISVVNSADVPSVVEQLLFEQVSVSAVDSTDEILESGNKLRLF